MQKKKQIRNTKMKAGKNHVSHIYLFIQRTGVQLAGSTRHN